MTLKFSCRMTAWKPNNQLGNGLKYRSQDSDLLSMKEGPKRMHFSKLSVLNTDVQPDRDTLEETLYYIVMNPFYFLIFPFRFTVTLMLNTHMHTHTYTHTHAHTIILLMSLPCTKKLLVCRINLIISTSEFPDAKTYKCTSL